MESVVNKKRVTHFLVNAASGSSYIIGFTRQVKTGGHEFVMSTPGANKDFSLKEFNCVIKTWSDWKEFFSADSEMTMQTLVSGCYRTILAKDFVNAVENL